MATKEKANTEIIDESGTCAPEGVVPPAHLAKIIHTQLDVYEQDAICSCGGILLVFGETEREGQKIYQHRCSKCGALYELNQKFPDTVYVRRGDRPTDITF